MADVRPTNVVALEAAIALQNAGLIASADCGKAAGIVFAVCFPKDFERMNPQQKGADRAG